jgi:hypothetical protein
MEGHETLRKKAMVEKDRNSDFITRKDFLYYLLIISDLFTHPLPGSWESRTPEPAIQIETIVLILETLQLPV